MMSGRRAYHTHIRKGDTTEDNKRERLGQTENNKRTLRFLHNSIPTIYIYIFFYQR